MAHCPPRLWSYIIVFLSHRPPVVATYNPVSSQPSAFRLDAVENVFRGIPLPQAQVAFVSGWKAGLHHGLNDLVQPPQTSTHPSCPRAPPASIAFHNESSRWKMSTSCRTRQRQGSQLFKLKVSTAKNGGTLAGPLFPTAPSGLHLVPEASDLHQSELTQMS